MFFKEIIITTNEIKMSEAYVIPDSDRKSSLQALWIPVFTGMTPLAF